MSETTVRLTVQRFCTAVQAIYGPEFLRTPTVADMDDLLARSDRLGWPGMLGSVDCCHFEWKNCPKAWAGQYTGKEGRCTVILEAVADAVGRIWHCYFGMPGTNNDINVLDNSTLLLDAMHGIVHCNTLTYYYVVQHCIRI